MQLIAQKGVQFTRRNRAILIPGRDGIGVSAQAVQQCSGERGLVLFAPDAIIEFLEFAQMQHPSRRDLIIAALNRSLIGKDKNLQSVWSAARVCRRLSFRSSPID